MKNSFAILAALAAVVLGCTDGKGKDPQPQPQPTPVEEEFLAENVETYSYDKALVSSKRYIVFVNDVRQHVYVAPENHICSFGCKGKARVKVMFSGLVSEADLRPLSKDFNLKLDSDGRTLTFDVNPYDRVTLCLNKSHEQPLFIFANPFAEEIGIPDENDPNVKFYKAGDSYSGYIRVESGQTLYVEGGAILNAKVYAQNVTDVTVKGFGIINGWENFTEVNGLRIQGCDGVRVKGVTIICNTGRAFFSVNSSNLEYDNVKVIGTCAPSSDDRQTDAMDLYADHDGRISRCFCFSNDDNYCIKTWKWNFKGETHHISFEDCIAWNWRGNGFEIGYETGLDVHDISYKNIYSIYSSEGRAASPFRRGAVTIHGAAGGTISGINYENVYIEGPYEGGIDMRILKAEYQLGTGEEWAPGIIRDVKMKNVHILSTPPEGNQILGYDATHGISLDIEDLYVNGERVNDLKKAGFRQNNYANITLK